MPTYEELRQRHLADSQALVPDLVERLSWPAERLAGHRRALLRGLLAAARAGSPWHAARLGGLDPDTVSEDELIAAVPVMTKDDLMDHYDEILTEPRLSLALIESHLAGLTRDAYLLDEYHAAASGGSTGRRGVFVYGWEEWAVCYYSWVRHLVRARSRYPELAGSPLVIGSVAAGHPTHLSSSFFEWSSNPEVTVSRLPVTLPTGEITEGLNRIQPVVLQGYPSALYGLTHEARVGRLRIRPRRIFTSSEPLLPEIRAALEETWQVPVWNSWGLSEGGGLGVPCEAGPWLHLADDLFIVEPVDTDGRPVPPGTRSAKILLTNLYNKTLPLIRFEVTDEITVLPGPCPCGSGHRRIADIEGRLDDSFRWGTVEVHPHAIRTSLARERHVVEYQVRQRPTGVEIDLRCAGPVDVEQLRAEIADHLRRLGLDVPKVVILVVEQLARQETGKLKRFVPLPKG